MIGAGLALLGFAWLCLKVGIQPSMRRDVFDWRDVFVTAPVFAGMALLVVGVVLDVALDLTIAVAFVWRHLL